MPSQAELPLAWPPLRAGSYRPGRRIQGLTRKRRKHCGFGMKWPHAHPASGPVHMRPALPGTLVSSSSLTLLRQQPPGPIAHSAPDLVLQHPYLHTYGTACSLPVSRVHGQLPQGGSSLGSSLNPPQARHRISAQTFTEEMTLKSVVNVIHMKFKNSVFWPRCPIPRQTDHCRGSFHLERTPATLESAPKELWPKVPSPKKCSH